MALDDSELALFAGTGDREAFSELVRRFSNAVYGVAFHKLGDFHFAQDVAQEVFLKAYTKLPDLRDPDKVGSWLYSITQRECMDWLKSRKQPHRILSEVNEELPSPDNLEDSLTVRDEVGKALSNLPEASRLAVILHYIGGYSTKEIADFLGLTAKAVEHRLHRAKVSLRMELTYMVESDLKQNRLGGDFEEKIEELLRLQDDMSAVGKQMEALKAIQEAVTIRPDDVELRKRLAHCLLGVGFSTGDSKYFRKSEEEYLRLVETDPTLNHGLGYVYIYLREYDKAIDCFKKLLDHHPDGFIPLAQAYQAKGDYEESVKHFQQAIANGLLTLQLGLGGLSQVSRKMKDNEMAYKSCRTLIDVLDAIGPDPSNLNATWNAYEQLAAYQCQDGYSQEAVDSLREAAEIAESATAGSSSVFFNRLTNWQIARSHEGTDLHWLLNDLKSLSFAALKGIPEYEELVEEIQHKIDSLDNR